MRGMVGWFLVAVLALGFLVFLWLEKKRKKLSTQAREMFEREWQRIELLAERDLEKAVLLGDKLLDAALRRRGVRGRTMSERLKKAQGWFSDLRTIRKAHYLRNKIAHETDFKLREEEGRNALNGIKRGLKDLWS